MTHDMTSTANHAPTSNHKLLAWVKEMAELCQPERIHWCDGSDAENQALCDLMVKSGTFIKLNAKKL